MTFEVIPVIDLMRGRAVRGVAGNRADYRPLATALCPDGDPLSAARGFLALHAFTRLYIADLDAIEERARQDAVIACIAANFPGLELWVDAGFVDRAAAGDWRHLGLGRPVLGSESLHEAEALAGSQAILSLDFRGDTFLGPPALLAEPTLWPDDVIVMCLQDVGTGGGPDIARLKRIIGAVGGRRIYAAGGVRGRGDLEVLARIGASGVLVASALHNGTISSADLAI